ncbi:MAG: hypothetical protein ACE5HT_17430, partial [Gemmatimonadales bacterium]
MPALALLSMAAVQPPQPVRYELRYDPAIHGRIQVQITVPEDSTAQVLVMPRAIPMGYSDVHYDRFVSDVRAMGRDGSRLSVARDEQGPRWRLDGPAPAHRVSYTVDVDALERESPCSMPKPTSWQEVCPGK